MKIDNLWIWLTIIVQKYIQSGVVSLNVSLNLTITYTGIFEMHDDIHVLIHSDQVWCAIEHWM